MIRSYGKPYGFAGCNNQIQCCGVRVASNLNILDEYQIQTPKSFVEFVKHETQEAAKEFLLDNKLMAGKPKLIEEVWYSVYSPVGELMVKCVEQAAKMMRFPVKITGEYLVGLPSEGWAGTH